MTSGSIKKNGRWYTAVTNAGDSRPWPLSVRATDAKGQWARPTKPVNAASNSAQGDLQAAGGEIWLIWQEHRLTTGRDLFASAVRVRGITGRRDRGVQTLYRGTSGGPGRLRIVEARGRTWGMYLAGSKADPALTELRITQLR